MTLDVLIIYTYYTYKLARYSVIAPAMLRARIEHTNELKDFLRGEWLRGFPYYTKYDDLNFLNANTDRIKSIISNWRYKDIVKNHLPELCISDFQNTVGKYSDQITSYNGTRRNLYIKIKNNFRGELVKLSLDQSLYEEDDRLNDFAIVCYIQYVTYFLKNKEYYYDRPYYSYNQEGTEFYLNASNKSSKLVIVKSDTKNLRLDSHGSDVRPLEKICQKMLSDDYMTLYNDDVNELQDCYGRLKEFDSKIMKDIDYLLRYPLLPGTQCDILGHMHLETDLD